MAGKATSDMTAVELAKVWAAQFGYSGNHGGWIGYMDDRKPYTVAGRTEYQWVPVAHGWATFAKVLEARKLIQVGVGVNWRLTHLKLGETPRLAANAGKHV